MHIIGNIFKMFILTIFIVFMVIWLGTLLKCEILTVLHGEEFHFIFEDEDYSFDELDYLKVIKYDDIYAKVYFIYNGYNENDIAFVVDFNKKDGQWTYSSGHHTIWATKGSASDVIFPYWWHFIYGGL